MEKLKASIDIIPEVEANLTRLDRDYEITRGRHLELIKRRESARLAQDVGQSNSSITFRVIESPRVPSSPSGPNRLLLLAGVFVAAMGAGVGWGLLRYLLHPTFIDYRQLRDKTGFPLLGSVSLYLSPQHSKKRRLQLVSFFSAGVLSLGLFGGILWYQDIGVDLVGTLVSRLGRL